MRLENKQTAPHRGTLAFDKAFLNRDASATLAGAFGVGSLEVTGYMRRFATLLCALLLVTLVLAGCRNDSDDGDDPPSAEEIVDSAAAAWDETETAHFTLEVEGTAFLDSDQTISLRSAEGDAARPDAVEADAKISAGFLTVDIGLVFIGDEAFMTDLITGNWGPAPDGFSYNPAVLFSDTEGLGPVLREMQDVALVGEEDVDGTSAYHLRGTVSEDLISALTAGTINGDPIDVDLWFATDDYRALQLVLGTPADAEGEPTQWTIKLSDHGAPVTIEQPTS
jgi:hypothetical protein